MHTLKSVIYLDIGWAPGRIGATLPGVMVGEALVGSDDGQGTRYACSSALT